MLMRKPECQLHATDYEYKGGLTDHKPFAEYSPREMLLGQLVLVLLFIIAILLSSM